MDVDVPEEAALTPGLGVDGLEGAHSGGSWVSLWCLNLHTFLFFSDFPFFPVFWHFFIVKWAFFTMLFSTPNFRKNCSIRTAKAKVPRYVGSSVQVLVG